jgi:hypothetical protein
MRVVTIKIKSNTESSKIDSILEKIFNNKNIVQLNWDLTELNFLDLNKILSIKPILEKYRPNIKKYLSHSNIITTNFFFKNIVKNTLPFLNPEKPVNILSPEEVEEHSPEYPQLPELEYPPLGQKQD